MNNQNNSSAPSDRDWPEDFGYENGQYMCNCATCGNTFFGYKRRVTCKVCAVPPVDRVQGGLTEREIKELWYRNFRSEFDGDSIGFAEDIFRAILSRQSMRGGEAQAEPKMTVRDGIWWPEGYCRDPNGVIVAPASKHADFKFGYDVGYAEGLVAHKDSVSAIESSRVAAEQAAAPEGCDTIEKAAWILECYHAYLQALSPINFDEHPYIPEIEGTAKDLRAMLAAAPSPQEGNDCDNCHKCLDGKTTDAGLPIALTRMILCPNCGNKRCPKASDHTLACTNNNEPGQVGSVYGIATPANAAAANGDGLADVLRDMLAIQEACGLHTDEYAPGSVIEYIKELERAIAAADADGQKGGQHG